MDDVLDQVRDAVEAPIDFEGQRLATLVNYVLLSGFGIVSFFVGFLTENVYYALYVGLAGLAVTLLAVVPPWPFYNRDPVQWLPASRGAWVGTGLSKKTN